MTYCWELFDENIYFGTDGKVCRADNGSIDDTSTISSDVKHAVLLNADGHTLIEPMLCVGDALLDVLRYALVFAVYKFK